MKKFVFLGFLAVFLLALVPPGVAKVKIGGIIFTDFFYLDRNKANADFNGVGNDPYTVTAIQAPDIARLYAAWTNEDNVGMYIELGLGQGGGGIGGQRFGQLYRVPGFPVRHGTCCVFRGRELG